MPLTSPRFKKERELIAVEAGRAFLRRGSTGRHIHLVQMALIDLGFAMPISTRSQDYSPDGVYGVETESVVNAFQRSVPPPGLKPDGVVGRLTLASSTSGTPGSPTGSTSIFVRSRSPTFPSTG